MPSRSSSSSDSDLAVLFLPERLVPLPPFVADLGLPPCPVDDLSPASIFLALTTDELFTASESQTISLKNIADKPDLSKTSAPHLLVSRGSLEGPPLRCLSSNSPQQDQEQKCRAIQTIPFLTPGGM